MKYILLVMVSISTALPLSAQQDDDRGPALEEFSREAEEAFRKLFDALKPGLEELLDRIDDLSHYQAPEILPNGDIIIRRRKDAPPLPSDEPIDL